jgi:hypothetical protein
MAAARTYAVNAGAPFAFATVGNSRFLDSQGLDITVVKASASFDTVPLVCILRHGKSCADGSVCHRWRAVVGHLATD